MEPFTLVIFGITSNLAQIKLIPTLYDLVAGDRLGDKFSVIGVGRTKMDQAGFATFIKETLRTKNRHHTHPIDESIENKLLTHLTYLSADLTNSLNYEQLKELIKSSQTSKNRMFYLATFPSLYESIFSHLQAVGLTGQKNGWTRVLIEKPIGGDRDSANSLNALLAQYFVEDQIFRLDHYLGKETLHDIIDFRFNNGFLESEINHENIDHIQVTATEDFGIGLRGSYYDQSGAIKDVGQNHLLQMLALATMNKPKDFTNESITQERVNILKNLVPEPNTLIIGQYEGYHKELSVAKDSDTETYFAFRTSIDNDRFRGVPVYVRAGKHLSANIIEIVMVFKQSNKTLTYRIGPNDGIILKTDDGETTNYSPSRLGDAKDAYERLIIDALRGDQTYFNDTNEIDAQWTFTDALISKKHGTTPIIYPKGSWGPTEADDFLKQDGRSWINPLS